MDLPDLKDGNEEDSDLPGLKTGIKYYVHPAMF
jgi:hypothetical protein